MHFVDECRFLVEAGRGGDGAVAFRREKFVPFGGPSGGDGGRGGSVVLVGSSGLSTLYDFRRQAAYRAERGENGQSRDCYGRKGDDLVLSVPLGTQIFDDDSGEALGEVLEAEQRLVVAQGGDGGRGNIHFATPTDRAPRKAEPGHPGETRRLRLELKVLADVGLLGFPNAGKSTFVRSVSRATPKVADYPFTTLQPHLGVVRVDEDRPPFVAADIPGLIEGASEGAGLGHRFLKHVERTRVLLHLVTIDPDPERDPLSDYQTLRKELAAFSETLSGRNEIVALSQADRPEVQDAYPELREAFSAQHGVELQLISAVTGTGIRPLLHRLADAVEQATAEADAEPSASTD